MSVAGPTIRDQILSRFKKNKCVPKSATARRKCDGLCIQGELLSGIRETKIGHKQTTKYTFQVMLDWDPAKLVVPQGITLNADGTINVQSFSTKKDVELPTIPHTFSRYQVVWMESFKKPEGNVRSGALLNLYNVHVTYWFSETKQANRFSFNVQSSTVVPLPDVELMKRYEELPSRLSHFTKPSQTDYYTTPTIVVIKDPSEDDMNKDVGFIARSPTAESVQNARFTIDIDGATRSFYDHNYMFTQWDNTQGLHPPGYFAATMWGAGDRGPGVLGNTFGITDPLTWTILGPKIVVGMEGVIIGYVDRDRTKEMDVNGAFYKAENSYDPQWGVQVKILRFISNAKRNIRNACLQVTSDFVNKVVFKKKTNAQSPFAQQNPWNDGMMTGLINMNEMMGDRNRLYKDSAVKFWFLCDTDITPEERSELDGFTPELRSACFTPGKHKNRPPMTFRWKTGLVYAELPTVTGKRKAP